MRSIINVAGVSIEWTGDPYRPVHVKAHDTNLSTAEAAALGAALTEMVRSSSR